ncbi:MAG: glycosyltransferase family 39 protein [Acidimicrobiia bacterium]
MKVDVAASAGEAHPGQRPTGARAERVESRHPTVWIGTLAATLAIATGLVLRFVAPADLWLDEALTVNIAKLPLDQLRAALERDGAPPLFYVLLHGWIAVFGAGDTAVRALAGVIGVIAVGLAFVAGSRFGRTTTERRWLGLTAAVVVATSPYAVRYSSEARMYSLVVALVLAAIILVADLWDRPSRFRIGGLAVVSAGLLYSQYWSLFLAATVVVVLVAVGLRGDTATRAAVGRVLVGIAMGGLLFIPWIPTLRLQLAHTGTPWDAPAELVGSTWHSVVAFGGGRNPAGWVLTVLLGAAAVIAVVRSSRAVALTARALAVIGGGTLGLAVLVSVVAGNGVQDRYASVVFPFAALVGALGVVAIGDLRVRVAFLAVIVAVGIVGGVRAAREVRTASGAIAGALVPRLAPGDVVGYCPDQLGPSTARLVDRDLGTRGAAIRQVTFPNSTAPDFVDWYDYADRNHAGDPARFARSLDRTAGAGSVWLVWSPGYRTLGTKCEAIVNNLARDGRQSERVTGAAGPDGERVELRRFAR